MVKRTRRKLPATLFLALSRCSLLLGFAERGSDSRYSPQAACNSLPCTFSVQLVAELAIRTDSLPCEGFPSSLLLNRINFQYLSGTTSERAALREKIEAESGFEPLRNMPEYERIMEKLQ